MTRPPIILRSQWGAQPPQGCQSYGLPPDQLKNVYTRITVHHTAGVVHAGMTNAEAFALMRETQDFHQNVNGWCDVGYHFLIDPDGRIFEGRSWTLIGSHAAGANRGNLGICLFGNFEVQTPSSAAWNSLVRLVDYVIDYLDINRAAISGHRDINSTACPGKSLYGMVPLLRRAASTPPSTPAQPPAEPMWIKMFAGKRESLFQVSVMRDGKRLDNVRAELWMKPGERRAAIKLYYEDGTTELFDQDDLRDFNLHVAVNRKT